MLRITRWSLCGSDLLVKIRCDETRPGCENCAKFGCQCPGYQQQLRWSQKHQPAETAILQERIPGGDDQPRDAPAIGQISQVEDTNTHAQLTVLQDVLGSLQDGSISLSDNCDLSWLAEVPSTWPATGLDVGADHVDEPQWSSFGDLDQPATSDLQHELLRVPSTSIVQAPVHLSTTMIEYWFQHICPLRSTFDSEINNNRTLARDSWATSEAVFYTMQVMSAACLAETMPQLSESLPSLREQATVAITQRISQVRNLGVAPVTADLVFAVLAIGTSSHWVLPRSSDYPWLESARELLSIWSLGISAADALLHAYFGQALAYWEMLLAVVGRGSNSSNVEERRRKYRGRLRRAMLWEVDATTDEHESARPRLKPLGTLPNSWCGISNEVIEVFGQVLALCRGACEYNQDKASLTLDTTSKALCDIAVAHELAKELLNLDFDTDVFLEEIQGFYVETRDDNTPVSHLLQTAEAYRNAGLLLLYLTFDDLVVSTSSDAAPSEATDKETRARSLVDMALQLVATLEKIPTQSGSKFIHPMLYLSAAVGLRFKSWSRDSQGSGILGDVNGGSLDPSISQADWALLDSTQPTSRSDTLDVFLPQSILKVAEARRLIWSRLGTIRQAGPHKASESLLRLVKNMWSEYDKTQSSTSTKFWFRILNQTGLEMLL